MVLGCLCISVTAFSRVPYRRLSSDGAVIQTEGLHSIQDLHHIDDRFTHLLETVQLDLHTNLLSDTHVLQWIYSQICAPHIHPEGSWRGPCQQLLFGVYKSCRQQWRGWQGTGADQRQMSEQRKQNADPLCILIGKHKIQFSWKFLFDSDKSLRQSFYKQKQCCKIK